MAQLFTDLLAKGIRQGKIPAREKSAREWYREQAGQNKRINETKFIRGMERDRFKSRQMIGNMYLMYYDAKHKDTLPYWDRLPLIFPFKRVKGGFYGINLHYLPLNYRAALMDALYETTNNEKYDESTKLKINYKTLSNVSKFPEVKPCIKRYLGGHVKSRFMYIYPSEWDMALFLPLERFQGARKTTVWKDSKKKIAKD